LFVTGLKVNYFYIYFLIFYLFFLFSIVLDNRLKQSLLMYSGFDDKI